MFQIDFVIPDKLFGGILHDQLISDNPTTQCILDILVHSGHSNKLINAPLRMLPHIFTGSICRSCWRQRHDVLLILLVIHRHGCPPTPKFWHGNFLMPAIQAKLYCRYFKSKGAALCATVKTNESLRHRYWPTVNAPPSILWRTHAIGHSDQVHFKYSIVSNFAIKTLIFPLLFLIIRKIYLDFRMTTTARHLIRRAYSALESRGSYDRDSLKDAIVWLNFRERDAEPFRSSQTAFIGFDPNSFTELPSNP